MSNRVAGRLFFLIDGQQYAVRVGVTYNLGKPKREAISHANNTHKFKETPQVPFIEGEITDAANVDVGKFLELVDVTVTLELANGKDVVFRNAWQAGEGTVETEDAKIPFRFEAESAEELK